MNKYTVLDIDCNVNSMYWTLKNDHCQDPLFGEKDTALFVPAVEVFKMAIWRLNINGIQMDVLKSGLCLKYLLVEKML